MVFTLRRHIQSDLSTRLSLYTHIIIKVCRYQTVVTKFYSHSKLYTSDGYRRSNFVRQPVFHKENQLKIPQLKVKKKTQRLSELQTSNEIIIINQTLIAIIINFCSSMTYYRFFLFSCKSQLFVNISVYLFILFIYLTDFNNDISIYIFFFCILL